MNEPDGFPGELIDRLMEVVDADPGWAELGWFLTFAIGGSEVFGVTPETGHHPRPGTYGAEKLKTHRLVSRQQYFQLIRERLAQLVVSGLREDVLVRAIRNELTIELQRFAQTEVADTKREEFRARLESAAADPERLAEYRTAFARDDPSAALLSDEEIADRLREMAEHVRQMPGSATREAWERTTGWLERADAISDRILALWLDRYADRITIRGSR